MKYFPCAVVMPVHNKAPHLRRAIESVLRQTLAPAEVIVVDDASTDGSAEIAASYSRVRILRRETPGPGGYAARNEAIRNTSAPWVAFLDADDEWTTDHLETLSAGADHDGAFTCFRTRMPSRLETVSPFSHASRPRTFDFDQLLDLWLKHRSCPLWTGAVAFRRETLFAAGLFPDGRCRRGGDKDTWLRAAARSRLYGVPRVTATYHADSVNMVTRKVEPEAAHCIRPTIEALIEQAQPATASRLKRLYNLQVWAYAYARWRAGDSVNPAASGFYVEEEPGRYRMMRWMQATASPRVSAVLSTLAWAQRRVQLGRR